MRETIFVSFDDIGDSTNLFCPFSAEVPASWLAAVDDCSVQLYTDSYSAFRQNVSAIGFTEAFVEVSSTDEIVCALSRTSHAIACDIESACRISRVRARSLSRKQGGTAVDRLTMRATTKLHMWLIVINLMSLSHRQISQCFSQSSPAMFYSLQNGKFIGRCVHRISYAF